MGGKSNGVRACRLCCNGLSNPLGISTSDVELSWNIEGEGTGILQTEFQCQIAERPDFSSGSIVLSEEKAGADPWVHLSPALKGRTVYYWRIRLHLCQDGQFAFYTDWSETARFETALEGAQDWRAVWIEADSAFYEDADALCKEVLRRICDADPKGLYSHIDLTRFSPQSDGLRCVPCFRRSFSLSRAIQKARLYISARGFYEARLNGNRIGELALAPDFTAYDKCIFYQTFDVGELLNVGGNVLTILLGDGWYAGHSQGIPGANHLYGEKPSLIAQLEIVLADGSRLEIATDEDFEALSSAWMYADLFMGECLDLTASERRYGCAARDYSRRVLVPQEGPGIQEVALLKAQSIWRTGEGEWIVDFGQCLAGRERIALSGQKNAWIRIEHSEALTNEGDIMRIIPRFPWHDQTDYIQMDERGELIYEPRFSYQGFRYLIIGGIKGELKREQCQAVVLESNMADTIFFQCDNDDINRLVHNAQWSQRGNMLSIPTDCPQRERGGFTGDAQVFCRTAAWHQDVKHFFRRWLKQARLEQFPRGQIPIVVPYTRAYSDYAPNPAWTSTGWGDAIIFIPWDLYGMYGDLRLLEENYDAMERWMDYASFCAEEFIPERFCLSENRQLQKYLWNAGFHWGDWLMPGVEGNEGMRLTREVTASMYYYREAETMIRISEAVGRADRAEWYSRLAESIRSAFQALYIDGRDRLTPEFQGMYVMAIAFGLVDGAQKERFVSRLNELVEAADFHLQTGFLSTPLLMDVLWNGGCRKTAARVLLQDTCPSWLYPIRRGATTIWEKWDDAPGLSEWDSLSSYNHYAYGSVCDFIYRTIGGVRPLKPGFSQVEINPTPIDGVNGAAIRYRTPFGWLEAAWERGRTGLNLTMTVPHGMTARVVTADGCMERGSGTWRFQKTE